VGTDRRTPAEVSQRFAEAINAGDLESALACWSPAGVIAAPDGSEIRGHAALTERFQTLIAARAQLHISVSEEISSDLGTTAATLMTITIPNTNEPTITTIAGDVRYAPGEGGLQILIDRIRLPAT
jgi:ketosteroid isomerase-like protein